MNSGVAMSRARILELGDTEWMPGASCLQQQLVFYATQALEKPTKGLRPCEIEALEVCFDCPVLDRCCDYSLSRDVSGVAGGLTEWERRKLRTKGRGAA